MWPAALTRLFRRRLIYIIIAVLGLIYFFMNLLNKRGTFHGLQSKELHVKRTRPLIWRTLQEHVLSDESLNNRTNDPDLHCRNSVQGRDLLVDERGFVCSRMYALPNGCCDLEQHDLYYYTCQTCNEVSHCCNIYEYCVSCCLHPSKRPLLEIVLRNITGRQALLYSAVEDHFELCLVKCRTNSHSVEHENKYRNAEEKYCYGPTTAHESQREVAGTAKR